MSSSTTDSVTERTNATTDDVALDNSGFHSQALVPYVPMDHHQQHQQHQHQHHHHHRYHKIYRSLLLWKQHKKNKKEAPSVDGPATKKNAAATKDNDDVVMVFIEEDVIPIILSYCDAKTLSNTSLVCTSWNRIATKNEYWENLCRYQFGISASEIRPSPDPIKQLYILSHRRMKAAFAANTYQELLGVSTTTSARIDMPISAFF